MEPKELLQQIDNYLLDNTVNNNSFNLFTDIKKYLTDLSIPIGPQVILDFADNFENTEDYRILKEGYDWTIDADGYLACLTAGDQHYESTIFKLDISKISR